MNSPTTLKTQFRSAEDSPGFMLWKAANLLQRAHTGCLRELNITPTQFSLMTCLVYLHQHGPVTAARIVEHAGMDKMLVSDVIKALERKKLLRRRTNPGDGRSRLLEPTALGERITNSAVRKVEDVDTMLFGRVRDVSAFHTELTAFVNGASTS
jgi:DNA-binding MarR family transcriptional regulator